MKKRKMIHGSMISFLLLLFISIAIYRSNIVMAESASQQKKKSYNISGCHFLAPESWEAVPVDDSGFYLYPDENALLYAAYDDDDVDLTNDFLRKNFIKGLSLSAEDHELISDEEMTLNNGIIGHNIKYQQKENGVDLYYNTFFFSYNNGLVGFMFGLKKDYYEDVTVFDDDYTQILNSITLDGEKEDENATIDFSTDEFSVKYNKHEISKDRDGNKCLLYFYEYENLSDKEQSPQLNASIKAYQNGVECEETYLSDGPEEYKNSRLAVVQPGDKLKMCIAFKLTDESDVKIEIQKLLDLIEKKKQTQIISLK